MHADLKTGHQPRVLLAAASVAATTGGIAMVNRSLMRLLARRAADGNVDFRVLSIDGPDDGREEQEIRGLTGSRFRHFGGRRLPFSCAVLAKLLTWADLAVFTHVGPASLLALAPRRLLPPVLTWMHGIEVWTPLSRRKQMGLQRSWGVLSISRFSAQRARHFNPWLPEPEVCHLGIADDGAPDAGDLTAAAGIAPGPHDVAIVGRMAKGEGQKGHRELIEAMERVVRAVPDARLLVAGGGNDVDLYKDLARRSPASEHIHFLGFLGGQELKSLYRRSAVFAMPSRQEGFGLVYLEAMRAGLPCVASHCDAAQEVVADGETGVLVDPADRQALAGAIARLLGDAELRAKMGEQGRARFLDQFTEEKFHARFWAIVERTLAERTGQADKTCAASQAS